MRVYTVIGTNQDNVSSTAAHFAAQNNGVAGPVEQHISIRCDNVDSNKSVQAGPPGPAYMCRVDY